MATRKKTKFEEELDKILEDIAANNEDWNDPLQKGMYDFRQFQNGTAVREDDPLTKHIKEQPVDIEAYFKTEPSPYPGSKYGWPMLAKEGEPAYNDPGLILRNAAATAGDRRDRNIETAKREFAQAQDDFDRTFNPTDYGRRRSGRVMPLGGRAGMANMHRPQYVADMNRAVSADEDVVRDHKALASANSLEAERNKAKGFLGINKRDDGSTYFTGSEQVRQNLEKTIGDYDREIAKLQAEIAMSEAGDPMYDLAVMRMIMNNDNSLMMDIRGRIGKKIDQEFQMKQKKADQEFQHNENELNRENTLETAKLNKQEQDAAKEQDLEDAAERAKDVYMAYRRRLSVIPEEDPRRAELEDQLNTAEILMKQAYRKANKLNEYDEIVKGAISEEENTLGDRKTILFKALNVADDEEFKSLYESGDAAQKAEYERMAKALNIPLTKLKVSGTKAKDEQKKEQNEKAAKTKKDFKDKNVKKTFEINILDGKAEDTQAWVNFQKEASKAGWTVELQPNGTILWK